MKTIIAIMAALILLAVAFPRQTISETTPNASDSWLGECRGIPVTFYGKPLYHLDPDMQHMAGHDCMMDIQCNKWSPAPDLVLKCCQNNGECFVYR